MSTPTNTTPTSAITPPKAADTPPAKTADAGPIPAILNRQLSHEYPLHPLTAMFPLMGASEFSSLVSDIEANGCRPSALVGQNELIA
jgi:hypothetical protein